MEPEHNCHYRSYSPGNALASLVDSFWLQDCPANTHASAQTIAPAARCELVFCYGDPFVHVAPTHEKVPTASIQGLRTRSIRARATGRTGLFIVNLHPWALGPLCGINADEASDRSIDLTCVWGCLAVERVLEGLVSATNDQQRVAVVVDALWTLASRHTLEPKLPRAIGQLAAGQAITVVADDMGIGPRQFRRIVRSTAGVSPKGLAAIVRYQRALGLIKSGAPLAEVAVINGYVDQAHMSHEIKRYTGQTPGHLVTRASNPHLAMFNKPSENRLFGPTYL